MGKGSIVYKSGLVYLVNFVAVDTGIVKNPKQNKKPALI